MHIHELPGVLIQPLQIFRSAIAISVWVHAPERQGDDGASRITG